MNKVFSKCLVVALIAGFSGFISPGMAQSTYPHNAVSIVVPFPAGGRTDLTARSIAEGLEARLGVSVVVVNKPGAGGVVGALTVAHSKPDGYTLGLLSSAVARRK